MILAFAKRQILSNILTLRFTISFIICEILFVASAIVLTKDYTERLKQYRASVQRHEANWKDTYTYARLRVSLDRPPVVLSMLCEGADKRLGTAVSVAFDRAPTIAEESGTRNPLLAVFTSLDLATVIQVILSLMVLLFAYNSISGEREMGTLRLVLSNTIPRYTILLGNFLGGMISLIAPLIVGLISALLIMLVSPLVQLSSNDWLRIFIILILAILYLSAFYSLGMLFSSRIGRSTTVLILLLFIWVAVAMIQPHAAVYLGKHLLSVPDRAVIDNQAQALRDEWERNMYQYLGKHPRPQHDWDFIRGRNVYTGDLPYAFQIWYAPKEVMQWEYDGSIYGHNLRMEYEDRIWQLYKNYQVKLEKQAGIARMLSLFSPSWIFYHACASIAATSEANYLRFLDQAEDYRRELINYMKGKEGLSSYLLFTRKPIDSFLTHQELTKIRQSQRQQAIENIIGPGNGWNHTEPLDLNDLPAFHFKVPGIRNALTLALPEILLLIFLNLILFSSAWVAFMRADVR